MGASLDQHLRRSLAVETVVSRGGFGEDHRAHALAVGGERQLLDHGQSLAKYLVVASETTDERQ
jgi:hypothetical protein